MLLLNLKVLCAQLYLIYPEPLAGMVYLPLVIVAVVVIAEVQNIHENLRDSNSTIHKEYAAYFTIFVGPEKCLSLIVQGGN